MILCPVGSFSVPAAQEPLPSPHAGISGSKGQGGVTSASCPCFKAVQVLRPLCFSKTEMRAQNRLPVTILLRMSEGCRNKAPHVEWLKQQKITISQL